MDKAIRLGELGSGVNAYYYPKRCELFVGRQTPPDRPLPRLSTWELDIPWQPNRLAIAITMQCNLNCHYCYNRFNRNADGLSRDLLFRAIDDLATKSIDADSVGLIFSGGEPMLRRDDFEATVEYAEDIFSKDKAPINISLYTNGTLLNEDAIEFLFAHQISVIMSLDGPKKVHDRNRSYSNGESGFDTTIQNLRNMIAKGMRNLVQTRAVVYDPQTDLTKVIDINLAEGVTRMHLMPEYGPGRRIISTGLKNWILALKVYEIMLIKGVVMEVSPFYRIFRKLYYPKRFADSQYPCTAGKLMLGIGSDGFYYLCHHYSGTEKKLGRIGEGLPERMSYHSMAPSVEQRTPCCFCWARHLCGGFCYHREYIGAGPLHLSDCAEWCELIRHIVLAFIRICILAPNSMRIIAKGLTYVPNIKIDSKDISI